MIKRISKSRLESLVEELSGEQVRKGGTDVLLFKNSKLALIIKTLSDESEGKELLGWRQQPRQEPLAEQAEVRQLFSSIGISTAVLLLHPDMPKDVAYITFADYERDISIKRTFRISPFKKAFLKKGGSYTPEKNELDGQYCDFAFLKKEIKGRGQGLGASQKVGKTDATQDPYSVIFCGPPGTGKTRAAMILAHELLTGRIPKGELSELQVETYPQEIGNEARFPNIYRTQFHPSLAYEDFLEGLRPVQVAKDGVHQDITYRVIPGVFKVVCQLARAVSEPGEYGIPLLVEFSGGKKTKDGQYVDGKWRINEGELALYRFKHREGVIRFNKQDVQLTGPIGEKETFRPKEGAEPSGPGSYPVEWFARPEGKTRADFVLVIDELNRGNPSRIFGEALSLIEDSKRIGSEEKAQLILPYSHEEFAVPKNLHIICAMNMADKSLAVVDQAFRRRFKFVYLDAQFDLLEVAQYQKYLKHGVKAAPDVHKEVIEHFVILNKALLGAGVNSDQHVGHSYGFKLLGEFYRVSSGADKNAVGVARKLLLKLWSEELHSLVHDILGEHENRLAKFCDKIVELSKEGSEVHKRATAEQIKKFVLAPNPVAGEFPWAA